ncbi:hypothetical protein ASE90_16605 [Sphingomonas sp. Leaf67]|uniref:LPD7 domain-containing protein n=1 Tax=Sphingomonas sp. Leaf67 TaxID=1736230 RepID=UPI0006FE941F|nr:LPD7 domain-containing protein [Sphingomonas sp. Leaf67]KQN90725.1 hypothetical protein ASE90_16605 [Sphingomonas sp. Leaf67]
MSIENTVTRGGRDIDPSADQGEQAGFQIPPELRARYEVRIIRDDDGADRRIGLFLAGDRDNPSIEISGNGERIVARTDDREAIDALVEIAKHNGWEGIDVDGSPEFRRAVWAAGTREGLVVRGYEPAFAELGQMDKWRDDDAERREREASAKTPKPEQAPNESEPEAPEAKATGRTTGLERSGAAPSGREVDGDLSSEDQRLLLTISAHTRDRKALAEDCNGALSPIEATFISERFEVNRHTLDEALNRALGSETLVNSFRKAGYEPKELRGMAAQGLWDKDIADAIYLVRSDSHRETLGQAIAVKDETGRYRIDRYDAESKEFMLLGQTDSPSEAATLFNRETDTRIVDRDSDRTVGHAEWINDGSFPRWRLHPAMEQLIEREAATGGAGSSETHPDTPPAKAADNRQRSAEAPSHHSESEALAELFLHGAAERISAEPRLANAMEAQAVMERHLGELFQGEVGRTAAATLESRQMISDVLRRGLDVSVREPTPVRQIEPSQPTPDMER